VPPLLIEAFPLSAAFWGLPAERFEKLGPPEDENEDVDENEDDDEDGDGDGDEKEDGDEEEVGVEVEELDSGSFAAGGGVDKLSVNGLWAGTLRVGNREGCWRLPMSWPLGPT